MTPQEKAIYLVDKFYAIEESIENDAWIDGYLAKQCALIAVDEILDKDGYNNDYWNEVKNEIQEL